MRRILSGVFGYPHFGQRVLTDTITFSRLIFCFRGTGKSLPVLGSLRETVVVLPNLFDVALQLGIRGVSTKGQAFSITTQEERR